LLKKKKYDAHAYVKEISKQFADKFWKHLEVRENQVSCNWDIFVKKFCSAFLVDNIFANHQKYREAVKAALDVDAVASSSTQSATDDKKAPADDRKVLKTSWDRFTSWFSLTNGPDLVASVYSLLTKPYFFGSLPAKEFEEKLKTHPVGTYLVNFDEKDGWHLWYVEKPKEIKSVKLNIVGSVELSVSKVLLDKSIFKEKTQAKPISDPPAKYSIDVLTQQRSGGAYNYSDFNERAGKSKSSTVFEHGDLLPSSYEAGQTYLG